MTRDIDIVVDVSAADADRVCELFRADFYLEPEAVRESIAQRGGFNLIHTGLVVKVDLVVRKAGDYRETEFGRRRQVSVDDHHFFIVAPEDLVISKLDWARQSRSEVQLADVRNVLQSVSGLDRDYLERWACGSGSRNSIGRPAVSDTSPGLDARYRAMLLAHSGEARLRMAGSMYTTARQLVAASIRAADPTASPAAVRRALFLRFYGHEFDALTRERILVRLDTAGRRRVPVDWTSSSWR